MENRQYITFEEAKERFLQGEGVWYEHEQITQEDIDNYPDEYNGYLVGDWLSTVFCPELGDELEDMRDDVKQLNW